MDRKWFAVPQRVNARREISMRYFSLLNTQRKIISGWKKALFSKKTFSYSWEIPLLFPGERSSPRCCQSDRDQQPRRGAHRFPTNAARGKLPKKQGSFMINKLKDIWGIKINPFWKWRAVVYTNCSVHQILNNGCRQGWSCKQRIQTDQIVLAGLSSKCIYPVSISFS